MHTELIRNISLQFSLSKIVLMPAIIAMWLVIIYVIFSINDANLLNLHQLDGGPHPYIPYSHWSYYSLYISVPALFIILYIIGINEAATTENHLQSTTLRPVDITIYKLFGVTSYVWYLSLGILSTILYAYSNMFENVGSHFEPIYAYPSLGNIASLAAIIVISAFIGHMTAALVTLFSPIKTKIIAFISGIIVSGFTYIVLTIFSKIMFIDDGYYLQGPDNWVWFWYPIEQVTICLSMFLFIIVWMGIILHRRVRRDLGYHNSPYTWLLFSAVFSLYCTGYGDMMETPRPTSPLIIGLLLQFTFYGVLIFFISLYGTIFYEASRLNNYREFFTSISNRAYRTAWKTLPSWVLNIFIISFLLIINFLIVFIYPDEEFMFLDESVEAITDDRKVVSFPFIFYILFMVRDGIVMHICLLGNYFKRGGLMLILYFILAYSVLPFLLRYSVDLASQYYGIDIDVLQESVILQHIKCFFIAVKEEPYMFSKFLPLMLEITIFGYILKKIITRYH